ncbi:histone methylation protein DOT1 [Legionella geestiana]|uniref:Histone-lysine N-methyltransferase, H3 lysine-79 specific n=1 Tax=Legionella geestiana TaxID=45065 RepID=A0A0W0TNQ6_9GAMM|nr:hypothetical protein [Legionella geestiana]KTC97239.1 histone methylation protein DOT1 [Legionella geestiana]QBS12371.1 methyltransferase [Legionella geestiana]QDQ39916.1 methyltransferase [Legionella geestiana]STX55190.1 putative methyltransferases [Legionella geestiana]
MRILAVCLLLSLFGYSCLTAWRRRQLRQWQREWRLDELAPVFDTLYAPVDGFALSRAAREGRNAPEYTYGEVCFLPFAALMCKAGLTRESVFWDLGSGTGRAVLIAAMVFEVRKSAGVEYFAPLHEAAKLAGERLSQTPGFAACANSLHFEHGNFLETDFYDATHVFINASALFGDTWTLLVERLQALCPGTVVVVTSKRLPATFFTLTGTSVVEMSWGSVQAFLYQRNNTSDKQLDNIE